MAFGISMLSVSQVWAVDVTVSTSTTLSTPTTNTSYNVSGATLTNNTSISPDPGNPAVRFMSNDSSLVNNGNVASNYYTVVPNNMGNTGLSVINNAGATITTTAGTAIFNTGSTISTITNQGTIVGASAGITQMGMVMGSSCMGACPILTTLNNAQGGNNSTSAQTALVYSGILPINYNIIVNSSSYYGQLAATSPRNNIGTSLGINFGILAGSVLTATTYNSVLTGLSSSNILSSSLTGTSGSYGYSLALHSGSTTVWDLIVTSSTTNILPGPTSNLLSSVGSGGSLNPIFEGGILKVDSATSTPTAFTIKSTGGTIDANGVRTLFSGAFSNASGEAGKLIIKNTGAAGQGVVVLGAANTHSGGTEVQAGANLSISSASNIGSGTLALVGSSTMPAILTTTADMTISNPITVSGDPTFNVASGTTTTVSSPIADGSSSGDVVVTGGGTLALAAVNTYTGPTTIDSGSTLALSGSGVIATSSGVTNNGTFSITGKTSNVSVASYAQSSTGNLTMNYSPTSNQKLLVAGTASLAGGLTLVGSSGAYKSGKYSLLTASGVMGTFGSLSSNLSSLTTLGYQLAYDANNVYLIFTPNVADTQQSLFNAASALQNTYTLQNSVLANSFSYDCNEFGANGICVSAGGRNTAVSAANGLNNTSGLLIGAYRPHQHYRVGAYIDQNLSVNNAGSTVSLGNNTPLIGLFGAWNQKLDGTGMEVKVSAAYGQKNVSVTRQVVGTSEAGSGSSQLSSQGAQLTAKYGFGLTENVIVSPYLGMRYTQNNMGGYTEGASSTVTAPLTYSALNTNATTALAGVGASYRVIPKVTTFASAGVETDTNTANGTYSATGVTGLTPINFNANPVKTRPTATLGAYYDVVKNQRVGITGIYRQEPFQAVSTTTVMATYTIGL